MRKNLIISILVIMIILSGCNSGELDDLTSKVVELESELSSSQTELDNTINTLEVINNELDERKAELEGAYQERDAYKEEVSSLNQKLENLKTSINDDNGSSDVVEIDQLYDERIYKYENGRIYTKVIEEAVPAYLALRIVGYNFDEIDGREHEIIDLTGGHMPTVRFEIAGTLYDFNLSYIQWNDDMTGYTVNTEICHYDEITYTDVIFNSVLAEGLPGELLTWKDEDGKEFYFLIGDWSLGDYMLDTIISEDVDLPAWWENQ